MIYQCPKCQSMNDVANRSPAFICLECGELGEKNKCKAYTYDITKNRLDYGIGITPPLDRQVAGNHYKDFAIQPVEFIQKNNLSYIQGCIIKYICRYDKKGSPVEDLKKIIHYVELLIDFICQKN